MFLDSFCFGVGEFCLCTSVLMFEVLDVLIASHHFNKIIHTSVSSAKLYQLVCLFVLYIVTTIIERIENRDVFQSNDERFLSSFFLTHYRKQNGYNLKVW